MKRRELLSGMAASLVLAAAPGAVAAQTVRDRILEQLTAQGYRRIRISRTLLGRLRIVADGPAGRREIVLNPATGAVLRDYLDRGRDDDSDWSNEGDEEREKEDRDEEEDEDDEDEDDENEDEHDDEDDSRDDESDDDESDEDDSGDDDSGDDDGDDEDDD